MKSLTKSGIRELTAKYRSILKKCALLNAIVLMLGASSAFATDVNNWSDLATNANGTTGTATINVKNNITRGASDEDITISKELSIIGTETGKSLSGNDTYQGLTVGTSGNLTLQNITMQNFNNNTASGGAIYNNKGEIDSITGNFKDNTAKSGGAIYNTGTINSITGNFSKNTATSNGGAIFNGNSMETNIIAGSSNITFDGNYVTTGNGGAIYNAVSATTKGIVGLYADAGHSITFIGDKTTQTLPDKDNAKDIDGIYNLGNLNINGSYNGKMYTGTVNLYNVSDNSTPMGTTNIYGGTVNVAKDITQKAVNVSNGATLTTNGNVTTTDGIANAGTLNLLNGTSETSATINSAISGAGTTNIESGVINATKNITQKNINVKSGAELNSTGNIKVTENLTNNGTVSVYGIKGAIQNNAGGSLTFNDTTAIVDIDLTNSGTVNFNGQLNAPDFNFILTQNAGTMNFSTTAIESTAEYGKINTFTMNGGSVNIADGSVNTLHINQLNLNGNTNFAMDADLAAEKMDKIQIHDIANSTITEGKVIDINKINLLSATTKDKVSLDLFADDTTKETLKDNVSGNLSGLKYSETYLYDAKYSTDDGTITFTRHNSGGSDDFNPYLYAPSTMAQTTANITGQIAGLVMDKLDIAVADSEKGLAAGDMAKASNAWVKVMGFDDDVDFKHFNSVDSKAYTLAAGFNTDKVKFDNFDAAFGIYGGYIGGRQKYTDNKIEQNGGYVGLSSELTQGNAFLLSTINGGFINNEAENMYGTDKFDTRWFSVGMKGGYNYTLKNSIVFQPNIYAGYTLVNTEDYTSKSGVRVDTDNLNFFEIDPGFKLSAQIDKNWLGFIQGKYAIVMDNDGETTANEIVLPNISAKNYFEYGFGMNKSLTDAWSLNGEINRRDGGRTGWNGSLEFKYHF